MIAIKQSFMLHYRFVRGNEVATKFELGGISLLSINMPSAVVPMACLHGLDRDGNSHWPVRTLLIRRLLLHPLLPLLPPGIALCLTLVINFPLVCIED